MIVLLSKAYISGAINYRAKNAFDFPDRLPAIKVRVRRLRFME